MFHTLIESGSHAGEMKRRGSFFFGTFAFYMLLLSVAGVGSIYAYNAQLDEQSADLEQVLIMRFPPTTAVERRTQQTRREVARNDANRAGGRPQIATVKEISIQNPNLQQREVARAETPEVTGRTPLRLGEENFIPENIGLPTDRNAKGEGDGGESNNRTPRLLVEVEEKVPERVVKKETPQPTPATPKKLTVPSSVLSSKVISKPAPFYPKLARDAHAQGPVSVQILVDEQGRVISAQATGGHPLLRQVAVQAAFQARFTPTILNGQPVKVSGVITYNFVLQ